MNPRATVAVTGSTGALGGAVARQLADAGIAQRLLVRDRARAPQLARAEVQECSYDDEGGAARRALEGVRLLAERRLGQHLPRHRRGRDGARDRPVASITGQRPTSLDELLADSAPAVVLQA